MPHILVTQGFPKYVLFSRIQGKVKRFGVDVTRQNRTTFAFAFATGRSVVQFNFAFVAASYSLRSAVLACIPSSSTSDRQPCDFVEDFAENVISVGERRRKQLRITAEGAPSAIWQSIRGQRMLVLISTFA